MNAMAIRLDSVAKSYLAAGHYFGLRKTSVAAVRGVSLSVPVGSAFGLVGQSGSGKSTLARLVAGLEAPDVGSVEVCGEPVPRRRNAAWNAMRRKIQVVFQDPYTTLDPLITVGDSIAEPLVNLTSMSRADRGAAVVEALNAVRLSPQMASAYPHQLSGGERQRVCIARALVLRPDVVVCDEAVSALDAQTQLQIVELLRDLQARHRLTYLFISHDISIVGLLCERVAVMHEGRIVESGASAQVLREPVHPYTRSLVEAAVYFQRGAAGITTSCRPPASCG